MEVAIFIQSSQVASVEPAVSKCLRINLWQVIVTSHHTWPPHHNLSHLPWRQLNIILAENPDFGEGHRPSRTAIPSSRGLSGISNSGHQDALGLPINPAAETHPWC